MPTPPTLITIAPELLLSIAEYLPLHALQALVRCNRLLYHLLLGFLYKRAIPAGPIFKCCDWDWECLLADENGWKGRPWLGNARQVTLCLAAGMDVHMKFHCRETYTRLHLAARNRWDCFWPGRGSKYKSAQEEEEVMRILLAHGADVNTATESGRSPLHAATEYENFNMTTLLLDSGADVNKATKTGRTPLHFAVIYSLWSPLDELLAHGADVNKSDTKGKMPLHYAVRNSDSDSDRIRLLLQHGADPNKVDEDFKTPLHYCGRFRKMEVLLQHGADPNKADDKGMTKFHYALDRRFADRYLVLLLKYGADANLANGKGESPLQYAAKSADYTMVALLLEHGANPNSLVGQSPLQYAAAVCHKECRNVYRFQQNDGPFVGTWSEPKLVGGTVAAAGDLA
jgi:ankyrin repeat protein